MKQHPVEPSQGGRPQNEQAVPAVGSPPEHAQPEPTLLETIEQIRALTPGPTVEANSQHWAGMDGTTAYHLIERHADNWADIGLMMGEWLAANRAPPEHADLLGDVREFIEDVHSGEWLGHITRREALLARIDTVLNREPQQ